MLCCVGGPTFAGLSLQDRDRARTLLSRLRHRFTRLRLIWADSAYADFLATWLVRKIPSVEQRLRVPHHK